MDKQNITNDPYGIPSSLSITPSTISKSITSSSSSSSNHQQQQVSSSTVPNSQQIDNEIEQVTIQNQELKLQQIIQQQQEMMELEQEVEVRKNQSHSSSSSSSATSHHQTNFPSLTNLNYSSSSITQSQNTKWFNENEDAKFFHSQLYSAFPNQQMDDISSALFFRLNSHLSSPIQESLQLYLNQEGENEREIMKNTEGRMMHDIQQSKTKHSLQSHMRPNPTLFNPYSTSQPIIRKVIQNKKRKKSAKQKLIRKEIEGIRRYLGVYSKFPLFNHQEFSSMILPSKSRRNRSNKNKLNLSDLTMKQSQIQFVELLETSILNFLYPPNSDDKNEVDQDDQKNVENLLFLSDYTHNSNSPHYNPKNQSFFINPIFVDFKSNHNPFVHDKYENNDKWDGKGDGRDDDDGEWRRGVIVGVLLLLPYQTDVDIYNPPIKTHDTMTNDMINQQYNESSKYDCFSNSHPYFHQSSFNNTIMNEEEEEEEGDIEIDQTKSSKQNQNKKKKRTKSKMTEMNKGSRSSSRLSSKAASSSSSVSSLTNLDENVKQKRKREEMENFQEEGDQQEHHPSTSHSTPSNSIVAYLIGELNTHEEEDGHSHEVPPIYYDTIFHNKDSNNEGKIEERDIHDSSSPSTTTHWPLSSHYAIPNHLSYHQTYDLETSQSTLTETHILEFHKMKNGKKDGNGRDGGGCEWVFVNGVDGYMNISPPCVHVRIVGMYELIVSLFFLFCRLLSFNHPNLPPPPPHHHHPIIKIVRIARKG